MPLFGDILNVVGDITGKTSDYLNGKKVDINNIANDAGQVIGNVLNRTGATNSTNNSSAVTGALASFAGGANQTSGIITNQIFKLVWKFILDNIVYVLLFIFIILYLIFKKK